MNKAIFLDRDGVINVDRHEYTWEISDFTILPGVFEACRKWLESGFLIIVVTNQGGIAKGLYTHADVNKLHDHMNILFKKEGIHLTDIYYCPHHPEAGNCLCRKPGSLLVEKALASYDIDPAESFFIGDRDRDIVAGSGAGVKGVLVPVNDNMMTMYRSSFQSL
jgi:D-glycero-D-manno-heptose 1,7-bisphosphate phosphatase